MSTATESTVVDATARLARFASALRFDDIPTDVIEHAKRCMLDALGCGLYAAKLPWCQMVTEFVTETSGSTTSVVWATGVRVGADAAALANGTAAHGFELDDIHPCGMHPGPLAVSTALALADENGNSGKDVLTAIVAGYEVGCRVGMAVQKAHMKAGFHAQGTVGAFVAAATAASMLKLDLEQTQHTLGIVGSFASGLIAAQEGAMTKRIHSGRAAQSGVIAAKLAQKGFTGIVDVLENGFGGFCRTMGGGEEELELLTEGLGTVWELNNVGFKIHPTCGSTHSALDVGKQLKEEYGFAGEDVVSATVRASTHAVLHVGWDYEPKGITAAQMNMGFTMALVLQHGEVPFDRLTEEGITDPFTVDLAKRIEMLPDEEIDALGRPGRHGSTVTVELRDGRTITGSASYRRGSQKLPVTEDEIRDKFRKLAVTALDEDKVAAVEKTVFELQEVLDIGDLTNLLATG